MDSKKRVAVIGAGIGGLTTACYLAREGFEVSVYEKNSVPGGRCGQLVNEGHRFDLGATMVLMPGVYREVFEGIGLDFDKDLNVFELENLYKIWFDNGRSIDFTKDRVPLYKEIESFEKGASEKADKYISEGYGFYNSAKEKLVGRNFYNFLEFATPGNMAMLVKLKAWLTHQQYISKFFRDPHLQMAFTFQNIYVGQSPFESPAFFSMIPAIELTEGSFFPKNGIYSVVKLLTEHAAKLGVKIVYDEEVDKIITTRSKAETLLLKSGEKIEADLFIANADLPYVYRELLPDRSASEKLQKKKYSCSAMVFHWGVDKIYPQLHHHNVFLSDTFRTGLKMIFRDKSADPDPSFYVHAPVRTDPGAAPPGHDTLSVIVGIGHVDEKRGQDWQQMKKISREAVLRRLKNIGMNDLDEHIKFEICYSPKSWESGYNVEKGSVFGSLNHSLLQMGYFRPHNRHQKYRNLYFTGGSTHPGNGIPLVLLSSKLTSERIITDIKRGNK